MSDHFPMEENLQKVMSGTGQSPICSYLSRCSPSPTTEEVAVSPHESHESQHDSSSSDQDSEVAHEPIQERYGNPSNTRFRRVASKTIVSFGHNDPENPVNWRKVRSIQIRSQTSTSKQAQLTPHRQESSSCSALASCRS